LLAKAVLKNGKARATLPTPTASTPILFLNIYRAAGFENASSHSGRPTFITELASKGVSVRVLAELAGHSSIQTTQGYIDVTPQQMSAAVELL
jgi:integrase/recombinase XerD